MAGPNDLTTLAAVKQYLRIPNTNDDALLTALISQISVFMQNLINRFFSIGTYTDIINGQGYGAQIIPLANTPVLTVTSVNIAGTILTQQLLSDMTTNGYRFDTKNIYLNGYCVPRGIANVQITYTAGYAALPSDVVGAANEIVGMAYREIERIGQSSKVLNGENVNFITNAMTKRAERTMQNYKKVVPI